LTNNTDFENITITVKILTKTEHFCRHLFITDLIGEDLDGSNILIDSHKIIRV